MRIGGDYLYHDSAFPFKGWNTLTPAVNLSADYSPNAQNIDIVDGVIKRRKDLTDVTIAHPGSSSDAVLALLHFEDLAGNDFLVAVTEEGQYKYNSTTNVWNPVTTSETGWTGLDYTSQEIDWAIGFDQAPVPDMRKLVIANGTAKPIWTGTAIGTFAVATVPAGVTKVRCVAAYKDQLCYANAGGVLSQTVYWSDELDWSNFLTGTAGSEIIPDADGEIIAMKPLGDDLIIYAEGSIHRMNRVRGDIYMSVSRVIQDVRLLSTRSVVSLPGYHIIATDEGVFAFTGSTNLKPLSQLIRSNWQADIDYSKRTQCFAYHEEAKHKIYFVSPFRTGTVYRTYVLEYEPQSADPLNWSYHWYASHTPTSMGTLDRYVQVVGTTAGKVMKGSEGGVEGGSVTGIWETPDFTLDRAHLGQQARWIGAQLELKGRDGTSATQTISLSYSTDSGSTWTSIEDVTATNSFALHTTYFDTTARKIRLRVSTASSNFFQIRWFRLFYRPREAR